MARPHPTDRELVELAYGHASSEVTASISGHAATCAACRQRLGIIARERAALREAADVPEIDVVDAVLARLRSSKPA